VTENARGIIAILAASTAFVVGDAMVKLTTAELPSGEIICLRGLIATAMLAIGVHVTGTMRPLSILMTPMMLVRLASAGAATVFIVISVRHLPLAIVNTVLQVTPLAVTAGASIVFRERVSFQRWAAALTGFTGVVLIVQPAAGTFGAAAGFVLLALLFTTIRDLSTRGLDRTIPSIFVAAASAAVIALSGLAVAPFEDPWIWPSNRAWSLLTAAAACLFVATTTMVVALRTGEVSVVAPFRYAPVPLSILLGWWLWGDLPNTVAFLGIGLVLIAGLYMLHRERQSLTRPAVTRPAERSPAE